MTIHVFFLYDAVNTALRELVLCYDSWKDPTDLMDALLQGISMELAGEWPVSTKHSEAPKPMKVITAEGWIVDAARDGDQKAYERLYRKYAPMVHGILLSRAPVAEVDDLVQDVFLHALEKLHTLKDTSAFGAWIATIARNRAHDFFRRGHRFESASDEMISQIPGKADTSSEAIRILLVVRTLPEAYRETLVLRLVEGMTGPEIAEQTALTPASVRVNLHRGMKLLREKLGVEEIR